MWSAHSSMCVFICVYIGTCKNVCTCVCVCVCARELPPATRPDGLPFGECSCSWHRTGGHYCATLNAKMAATYYF